MKRKLLLNTAHSAEEWNFIVKETRVVNNTVTSLVDKNSALFALKNGVVIHRRVAVEANRANLWQRRKISRVGRPWNLLGCGRSSLHLDGPRGRKDLFQRLCGRVLTGMVAKSVFQVANDVFPHSTLFNGLNKPLLQSRRGDPSEA